MRVSFLALIAILTTPSIASCNRFEEVSPCAPDLLTATPLPPPALPPSTRKYIGSITVAFVVDRSGKVVDPRIVASDLHLDGGTPLPQSEYEGVLLSSIQARVYPKQKQRCFQEAGLWIN